MRLALLFSLSSLVACRGPAPEPVLAPQPAEPEWVLRGSGATVLAGQRAFFGVGVASNIKNVALLQVTADNRARAEITKIFETYSASLMKDYMASTSAGDSVSEEQHVSQAISTFSAQTLSGVQIVDRFKGKDGVMYSLARLDLDAFKDAIAKVRDLGPKVKQYVKEHAERVHSELEAEEQKHEGK